MLNFSKNNIVVPKNATKATKTTLCQNRRFWHLWVKIQKTSYLRNDCELSETFFSGKRHGVSKPAGNIFRPISAGFGHFEVNFWPYPQIKISKNRFFSIFVKCFLYAIRDRIRVRNDFRTPQVSISGHISSIQPLSSKIYNIIFLNFRIFCDFSIDGYVTKSCILWLTYVACKFREGVGRNPGSGNSGGESPFFSFPPKVANPKIAKITILP